MKQLTLIAFGDSLTYGYGVLEPVAYPAHLSRRMPLLRPAFSWQFINRGVNGDTTREAVHRLEQNLLRFRPQIAAVWLGANDSALNEGQYRTLWEFEKNMRFILERILSTEQDRKEFYEGHCLPLLITPPPVVDTDFYPFTTTDRIQRYRDSILKLAEEYHCPVIDLFQAFLQKKEEGADYEALFQCDGVHLSNAGYALLYPLLEEKLLELTEALLP